MKTKVETSGLDRLHNVDISRRWGGRLKMLIITLSTAWIVFVTGCGEQRTESSQAHQELFAKKVYLESRDMLGATQIPHTFPGEGHQIAAQYAALQNELAGCGKVYVANNGRAIKALPPLLIYRNMLVSSFVVLLSSEAAAKRLLVALSSLRGQRCLVHLLGKTIRLEVMGATMRSLPLSASVTSLAKDFGPGAMNVLVGVQAPELRRRVSPRDDGVMTAGQHNEQAVLRHSRGYIDAAVFRSGPAEIWLWLIDKRAIHLSTVQQLLSLLDKHASENLRLLRG